MRWRWWDAAAGQPAAEAIAVAGPARRQGVATLLMDAAEQLARDRAMTMDDDLIIWLTKDLVS